MDDMDRERISPKFRRLKRDIVTSLTDNGELVGLYFEDTNGEEVLVECSPEKADKIIEIWNSIPEDYENVER